MSIIDYSEGEAGARATQVPYSRVLGLGFKRGADILASLCGLLLLSPVLLAISLLILCEGERTILFRQRRNGLDGREFDILKFRTMQVGAETAPTIVQATRDDDRVTRVGAILRRTSLDELPQLFNVLRGDMSVVGPRPHAVEHNQHYSTLIKGYEGRNAVKPGITGLAQINGFRGEITDISQMEGRVATDLHYIADWSLWLDIRITAVTACTVVFHKQAY